MDLKSLDINDKISHKLKSTRTKIPQHSLLQLVLAHQQVTLHRRQLRLVHRHPNPKRPHLWHPPLRHSPQQTSRSRSSHQHRLSPLLQNNNLNDSHPYFFRINYDALSLFKMIANLELDYNRRIWQKITSSLVARISLNKQLMTTTPPPEPKSSKTPLSIPFKWPSTHKEVNSETTNMNFQPSKKNLMFWILMLRKWSSPMNFSPRKLTLWTVNTQKCSTWKLVFWNKSKNGKKPSSVSRLRLTIAQDSSLNGRKELFSWKKGNKSWEKRFKFNVNSTKKLRITALTWKKESSFQKMILLNKDKAKIKWFKLSPLLKPLLDRLRKTWCKRKKNFPEPISKPTNSKIWWQPRTTRRLISIKKEISANGNARCTTTTTTKSQRPTENSRTTWTNYFLISKA